MGPTSLFVRGPFRGSTGYAHHTREFVRELARNGVALQLESVPGWGSDEPVPAESADYWYATLNGPVVARIALQFCMPHQTEEHPDLIDVNCTKFEADRIPSTWVALSKLFDWTVVPTEFSRIAWIESGAPEKRLRVCPLGVRSELFTGTHEPWPVVLTNGRPLATYRFRFLNVSDWNTRKNLDGLVRTWLTATRATKDAALVKRKSDELCRKPRVRTWGVLLRPHASA